MWGFITQGQIPIIYVRVLVDVGGGLSAGLVRVLRIAVNFAFLPLNRDRLLKTPLRTGSLFRGFSLVDR